MRALVPCYECSRHVRPDETHCPFCGESVPFVPIRPARRWRHLGRAALLGFAAATMSACGGGADGADDGTVDDGSDGSGGEAVPAYGAPADPPPDRGQDGQGDDGQGDGTDNGSEGSEGSEGSADEGDPLDHGTPVALYGVPAPDSP